MKQKAQEASYAARTLFVGGVLILAYVVYHLMHFTVRNVHTQYIHEVDGHVDVYAMVVGSFQNPISTAGMVFSRHDDRNFERFR